MINDSDTPRSDTDPSEGRETSISQQSNPTGRAHPTTITTRVTHGTKGRAKDIARSRGVSLCKLVRDALNEHLKKV